MTNYVEKQATRKCFASGKLGVALIEIFATPKAIHSSVNYIEYNPVRAGLVNAPEEWQWSSAHTRYTNRGLLPDDLHIPVFMK